jgi:CIC family chloride channel protein
MSTLFIRSIYWFEDAFSWLFTNRYLRHTVGMFIVGIMLYIFMRLFGHYYIEGIGYSTIQDILNALITNPWLLLCLALGKLLVTCLSLGTGASGGVFSPALFLGAALGVLFGLLFNYFFPNIAINPVLFAMIGMAAMVGSATGAIITAILLTLEMTRDYYAIFPLIITTVIAYVVRKKICRDSVYTLKLTRRGCYIS